MSIQAKRRSPALIELPMSWKVVDKGLKPRMRWIDLNCQSLLTKTSDLRTLRSAILTKLTLGITYLLSTKYLRDKNLVKTTKPSNQEETVHQKKE